jgi:cytochrome c556
VVARLALLLCAVVCLAACGSSTRHSAGCPNQQRALAKIHRDVEALAAAYKLPVKDKLIGNHAINVATDKFLNDVALAPITNLQRNRLIDLAMSAIGTHCQQCFQALEAGRPIPAIRQGDLKCSS